LNGPPSSIDKSFAESIGLKDVDDSVGGLDIQAGDLTLHNFSAKADDLQTQIYTQILGYPLPFRLSEDFFNQVAVDIDFAHHRMAFRDPGVTTKPAGAIEVPLIELDGERVLSASINGASPAQFELELGNVIGPLMTTKAYAEMNKLFEGHPTSQRKSGRYSETVVSVDHLSFAGLDFPHAPIAIIPDTELPPASITGGVGLPLLNKFSRLIIDFSHNRLYAIPDTTTTKTPIEKDRIGLIFYDQKIDKSGDFGVAFVAPNSPAAAAGFKAGDKIALIDGKPFDAWPLTLIDGLQMASAGTAHAFTMADGTVRQVKAADFF